MTLQKIETAPAEEVLLAKGTPEDARYEMLASLIGLDQVKIEIDDSVAEDLKSLLCGKWMEEDTETADVYAIKVFGFPVSAWSQQEIEHYRQEYKKNHQRYADADLVMASAKKRYSAKIVIPVVVVAACAIGIFVKLKKK